MAQFRKFFIEGGADDAEIGAARAALMDVSGVPPEELRVHLATELPVNRQPAAPWRPATTPARGWTPTQPGRQVAVVRRVSLGQIVPDDDPPVLQFPENFEPMTPP